MSFAMDQFVPTPCGDLFPLSKVTELLLRRPVQYIIVEIAAAPVRSWFAEAESAEQRQQTVENPVAQRPFEGPSASADASGAGPLELVLRALAPSSSTALGASTETHHQKQSCEPATSPKPAARSPECVPGAWHEVRSRRSRAAWSQSWSCSDSCWSRAQQTSLSLEQSHLRSCSHAAVVIQKMFRGSMARHALHRLRQDAANLAAHTDASGEAGGMQAPPRQRRQKHHQKWADAGTTDDELLEAAIHDVQDELSRSASPKVGPMGVAVPPDCDHSIQARRPLPAGSLDELPIKFSDADKAAMARIARMEILASQLQAAQKDPSASARDAERALKQELSQLLAEAHNPQTTCSATAPVTCPTSSCGGTTPSRTAPRARGRSKR